MGNNYSDRVCPVEKAGGLDNRFRRFIQNPVRILKPYITSGDNILDFGCGPGFFTTAIAELTGKSGHVVACDLQKGMLEIVNNKINKNPEFKNIKTVISDHNLKNLKGPFDFILAFYVVHEVPDISLLFNRFREVLKENGKLLIVEPRGHVTKKQFNSYITIAKSSGFSIVAKNRFWMSRGILLF